MQSGAITGLSHFKGQGAKGDAPTQYIQALGPAIEEATSNLELDRIPADARDMVKDYFLKLNQDAGTVKSAVLPASKPTPKATGDEALKE